MEPGATTTFVIVTREDDQVNRPAATSDGQVGGPYRRVRANAWLGRTLLAMLHNVHELTQWITYIKTAHAPRFRLGAVFNG